MTEAAGRRPRVAIIGGGPAGLMAAEVLSQADVAVDLFEAMPSVGRKFLMAGKGGMNITHSEPREPFLGRYGARRDVMTPIIDAFAPEALRAWIHQLGVDTFVGSSGRVFPTDMKAAPLLRAWLHRLREQGVRIHVRHRWTGWGADGALSLSTPEGDTSLRADAVVLALGGGSWARLGSDGAWVPWLRARGVDVASLVPANCGFEAGWSEHFRERFAGEPVKAVVAHFRDVSGREWQRQGEFVVSATGLEGSLIYALSAPLRDAIAQLGSATLHLDLAPGKTLERVRAEVAHPRGSRSMASHLQSRVGIAGVKGGLLRECTSRDTYDDADALAAAIKALPVRLLAPRPIDETISSAGGVRFEAMTRGLMLEALPGVFCAGEMLDWEAPTGGYLLTGCFATGRAAARGVLAWLGLQAVADTAS
ncbi:TIGR03862 family flavoprotein [Niveibacterium microcysteis]|uniref:TIGR03862 family flavoprotein n=1 Tax=Niveibacterium microcysteis TaxID=2811415 RepID=A0ABX7M1A2_9RHOO|nr:TIGR03862 family flavoprotein [Niveibacterium microcysteis]QSI75547.1 TIGR03862 family flavoprotein [Niveibacterium microcysteis]